MATRELHERLARMLAAVLLRVRGKTGGGTGKDTSGRVRKYAMLDRPRGTEQAGGLVLWTATRVLAQIGLE